MVNTRLGIRVCMLCFGAVSAHGQETGSIAGTVLDPSGKPSNLALVRAVRLQPTRWTSLETVVDEKGGFTIRALAPGEYMLCAVTDPARLQVDPCFWMQPAAKPITVAGRPVTGQTVQLEEGKIVTVRIRDPKGLLKRAGSRASTEKVPALTLEYAGPPGGIPRTFLPGPTAAGAVDERQMLAPKAGPGRVRIYGQALTLKDAQARPILAGKFEAPPEQDEHEFEIDEN